MTQEVFNNIKDEFKCNIILDNMRIKFYKFFSTPPAIKRFWRNMEIDGHKVVKVDILLTDKQKDELKN